MNTTLKNNPQENFEAQFENERLLQTELENIENVVAKLKERYFDHKETFPFIDYLASTRKIFVMARIKHWGGEKLKKELVKSGAHIMSLSSNVDPDIFNSIGDDFQAAYTNIKKVSSIAQEILGKYEDCEECVSFIQYIKETLIILSDFPNLNINEAEEEIFYICMKIMSANDNPKLSLLEEIYEQFKEKLTA